MFLDGICPGRGGPGLREIHGISSTLRKKTHLPDMQIFMTLGKTWVSIPNPVFTIETVVFQGSGWTRYII